MNDLPNLVLTGFMGTGKTAAGRYASQLTGLPFVDTDLLIVREVEMPIQDFFRVHGEKEFRRIERDVCASVAGKRGQVISTGGGMLIDPDNLAVMQKNGVVICLWTSAAELRRRLTGDLSRPLANDWEALLEKRQPIYEAMPDQIYTGQKLPQQVAQEAVEIWRNHCP